MTNVSLDPSGLFGKKPSPPHMAVAAPPPPTIFQDELKRIPNVEENAALQERKMSAAKLGTSQFIWLPTVGTPTG